MKYHAVLTTMPEAVETAATLGATLGKELFAFADPQGRGATFIVADEPQPAPIEVAETSCPTRSGKSKKHGVCKTKPPLKGVVAIRSVVEGIREMQDEKPKLHTLPPPKKRAVQRRASTEHARKLA